MAKEVISVGPGLDYSEQLNDSRILYATRHGDESSIQVTKQT
jgi:hypothetical protein